MLRSDRLPLGARSLRWARLRRLDRSSFWDSWLLAKYLRPIKRKTSERNVSRALAYPGMAHSVEAVLTDGLCLKERVLKGGLNIEVSCK